MDPVLSLIGRDHTLFTRDIAAHDRELADLVAGARFLVLGGAGSIGQAVTREIFRRNPRRLDVVDLSENNLAELVRDLRSGLGYIDGEFRSFALDIGALEFDAMIAAGDGYDYVLNLSALKHVRSEKDPWTLMRLIDVNIFNTDKIVGQAIDFGARKVFCVSTDKAANPANMMGASKRIMEMFLLRRSRALDISTARFANVAFSDGSLLASFRERLAKRQPIAAPADVRRYFLTPRESGELCLMSCLLGGNREIFFPRLDESLHLLTFAEIAERFLRQRGYEPHPCASEDEARELIHELPERGEWPCLFGISDTTGEKPVEEFYTSEERPDFERFDGIGVIALDAACDETLLADFEREIAALRESGRWRREQLVELFHGLLPGFEHLETGRFLDGKM